MSPSVTGCALCSLPRIRDLSCLRDVAPSTRAETSCSRDCSPCLSVSLPLHRPLCQSVSQSIRQSVGWLRPSRGGIERVFGERASARREEESDEQEEGGREGSRRGRSSRSDHLEGRRRRSSGALCFFPLLETVAEFASSCRFIPLLHRLFHRRHLWSRSAPPISEHFSS